MLKNLGRLLPWRVVVDTNTWISGVLFPESVPGQLLKYLRRSAVVLVSAETMLELGQVLLRPKFERYLPLSRRRAVLSKIRKQVRLIDVSIAVQACRDSKDDKFLSLALAGEADMLISGDADLRSLDHFGACRILQAGEFLALVASGKI